MDSLPFLLSEQAVSGIIGKSAKTLKRWRREKTGPAWVRVGKTPQYDSRDLVVWMLRNRVEPRNAGQPITG